MHLEFLAQNLGKQDLFFRQVCVIVFTQVLGDSTFWRYGGCLHKAMLHKAMILSIEKSDVTF